MSAAGIALHRRADLARVIAPASVAIVGASARPGAFGERTLHNLAGYRGRIHLVNAAYPAIGERPCHPSLSALPEVPDCVVVALPRDKIHAVAEECAALGVGGMVVFASGYAETGRGEHAALQAELGALARRTGLRIIGPNCIGVVNAVTGAHLSFSTLPDFGALQPHAIGLVSQSGALGLSLAQAAEQGVSFSHLLTTGNSCDIDVADCIAYLADDPSCRVIACVFEGMAQPARLLEAARLAREAGKPLLVYKLATGEQGAAAALSHTGSLAGSGAAYRAAFAHAGIVEVADFEGLLEAAAFFAKAPPPRAAGVAVVATSGGASIMAADKAEIHGVALPQPAPAVAAILADLIPEFGSARNPCDVTAQVINDPHALRACADALLGDPAYGVLVTPQPYAYDLATPRIRTFGEIARRHGKMVCNLWLTQSLNGPGARESELDANVALFRSMDRCFATLAAWHRYYHDLAQAGVAALRRSDADAAALAAARLAEAGGDGGDGGDGAAPARVVAEREAKRILAAYGVPVVDESLVQSADEAVREAARHGYPVVMKVESPDLPHKTEMGVIRLDLRDAEAVRQAYEDVMANARKVAGARIAGVLVQPMVPAGVEVMVGGRIDPQFGPLVVVSLGGVFVELLKDGATALAPVSAAGARQMLAQLRGSAVFDGFRGAPAVDLDVLADVVARLSEFVADQRDAIAELDVNPLICAGSRCLAVDALIVRAGAEA